jgi:hypothetical protein
MTLPLSIRNPTILAELVPYIVATPFNLGSLNVSPFGVEVASDHIIDPLKLGSETFLSLLHKLDGLTFGPEGMPMPRWVFYDCAELPGAIFGLARPAATLWPAARAFFDVPDGYDGLVPLSMYIAIPMHEPGVWFGHNLASLAPVIRAKKLAPIDVSGLGSLTKSLALKCFTSRYFWGATQWLSKALFIHVKFGSLDLATAYTPAHTTAETLTYGFEVTDDKLRAAMGDPTIRLDLSAPQRWIDSDDDQQMIALQDEIEGGARIQIVGPPQITDGGMRVPIARLSKRVAWPGLSGAML